MAPPDRRVGCGPERDRNRTDTDASARPSSTAAPTETLSEADACDLDRVEALLSANDLPTEDVRTGPGQFYLARDRDDERDGGDAVVGVGGVERHGPTGLLRSVAVEESSRGEGYGTALCAALEDRARREGVETLYLLTTTAAGFFGRLGYGAVDRESVPPAIRSTTEFAALCPASATCMRKRLRGRATE
ncbi:arsenic resistance N-acetyltransferase ArsN2 [Halobaculum gomorrense]|uniref:Amino-acid N-acetyltransferase n=1 Tax=Halobaculum gomorrense TaxID=43928 RepID=A0A1M5T1L1_9EURY|nr:arsenic resistance N-acetyltransferase ArsN2 [Halobaculum gomorrense]SHH44605.1 amino-acid N-acetyltransferase [Halobaculum gomorrense]